MSFRFMRVAASGNGQAYVTASDDEQEDYAPVTRIFRFDGKDWSHFDLDFEVFSLAQRHKDGVIVSVVALGLGGEVEHLGSDAPREYIMSPEASDHADLRTGRFTQIREIAGTLYAVGEGGRNFRRTGPGVWDIMDPSLLQEPIAKDWDREFFPPDVYDAPDDPKNWGRGRRTSAYLLAHTDLGESYTKKLVEVYKDQTLWAINGENADSIYVGGSDNSIRVWQPEHGRFSEPLLKSPPTGNDDNSVLDIAKGAGHTIYCCGGNGLLIKGARDGFESAVNRHGGGHFASMTLFKSGHYLIDQLGTRGLWQFDGDRLTSVETGLDPEPGPLLSISSSHDDLWAVGSREILRFDGTRWERMPLPA